QSLSSAANAMAIPSVPLETILKIVEMIGPAGTPENLAFCLKLSSTSRFWHDFYFSNPQFAPAVKLSHVCAWPLEVSLRIIQKVGITDVEAELQRNLPRCFHCWDYLPYLAVAKRCRRCSMPGGRLVERSKRLEALYAISETKIRKRLRPTKQGHFFIDSAEGLALSVYGSVDVARVTAPRPLVDPQPVNIPFHPESLTFHAVMWQAGDVDGLSFELQKTYERTRREGKQQRTAEVYRKRNELPGWRVGPDPARRPVKNIEGAEFFELELERPLHPHGWPTDIVRYIHRGEPSIDDCIEKWKEARTREIENGKTAVEDEE
ncbi:hypothetical protein HDU93_006115, partial [Gonapodya sp. JEL0774]